MREATRPTGETYYKDIMCYVYDILCISHNDRQTTGDTQKNTKLKNDNIEEPYFYLYAILNKKENNGRIVWTMTSHDYIKNAIDNLENQLKNKGLKSNALDVTPMAMGYQPEFDSYP